jgi:N-dimethylarginine dimethylaminohydrolase
MRQRQILMCPPDYYGIEYEINPWMSRSRGSTPERARQQWNALHQTLRRLGVQVELMTPQPGLPDLVFTANAGLIFGRRFFSSRFRHEVRARETLYYDAWFEANGFTVEHLPEGMFFEGAGDALFCGAALFAGYRIRSDVQGHQHLAQILGKQVLPLELINPHFYHLDTCFCPLAPGEAIYYPDAFDAYGRKVLETHIPNLLTVNEAEAVRFGCNAVVVDRTVITNTGCDRLAADLRARGHITSIRGGSRPGPRRCIQKSSPAPANAIRCSTITRCTQYVRLSVTRATSRTGGRPARKRSSSVSTFSGLGPSPVVCTTFSRPKPNTTY